MSSKAPKIWMIIPSFAPAVGGTEKQARQLAKCLMESGWSVCVLTRRHGPSLPRDLPAEDELDGIPIVRIHSRGKGRWGSLLYFFGGLWHLLCHGRRGIYHAHDIGAPGWMAAVARYLLAGRCVLKMRTGQDYYEGRLASGAARWGLGALLRLADCIVVVNSEVETWLVDQRISLDKVARIPNGVDAAWFRPSPDGKKRALREQLGLPTDRFLFSCVGRLAYLKGVDVVLQAWASLPDEMRHGASLVVVGDGAERERLEEMIESLQLEQQAFMVGIRDNVRDYYWASDVFVLPSRTEGLSNALLEAMACALPVVASDVGGALDVVEEGRNGVLFDSQDYAQLAQKITLMIAMRDQWREMGTRARQRVLAYADLDKVALQLMRVYSQFPKRVSSSSG